MGHTNDFAARNWRELRQRSITPAGSGRPHLSLALLAALALPANAMAADAIIVKRAPGLDRDERLAVRADADVKLTDMLTLPDTEVVVPRDGDVDEALEALNANPDVVYAEPDTPVRLQSNDPLFGKLYGLENTGQTIWASGRRRRRHRRARGLAAHPRRRRRRRRRRHRLRGHAPRPRRPVHRQPGRARRRQGDQRRRRRQQRLRRRLAGLGLRQRRQHGRDREPLPRDACRRHDRGARRQRHRRRRRRAAGEGRCRSRSSAGPARRRSRA